MDVTVSRLHGIALTVCTECCGVEHFPHTPAGYRITGMYAYARLRPDCAVALFGLSRGSVVVKIDKQPHWMWWLRTLDAGEAHYANVKRSLYTLPNPT
jgi:hypothetical protein